MSIVEFNGPLSWSLDACKTGESTKYPWVWVVGAQQAGEKSLFFFFFCLEATCVLTPLPVPTEILFSPQFQSHQETNMAARQTQ